MNYTFFIISTLGVFIAGFCSVYVFERNPASRLNRYFSLFIMAIALYNLFDAVSMLVPYAPFFMNIGSIKRFFWLLFWPFFLQFALILSNKESPAHKKIILPLFYLVPAVVWAIDLRTNWLYLEPKFTKFGYYAAHGPYFVVYVLYLLAMAFYILGFLYTAYRNSPTKREKKQNRIILLGMIIVTFFGFSGEVILHSTGIVFMNLMPLTSSIYSLMFSYAIIRYGLLTVTPGQIANDILLTMPDIAVFIDNKRNIKIVNQMFMNILGYSESEVMDRPFTMIFSQEAEVQGLIDDAYKKGRRETPRILVRKKGGATMPVKMELTVTKDRFNEEIGCIIMFRDISQLEELLSSQKDNISELTKTKERMLSLLEDTAEARDLAKKRSEELAVALENMKSIDKMKNEFLSVISHELRTPLTPIIGYISMFISETFGKLDPKYVQKAEIIKKESERLHELIDSLLDVSRLERGDTMQLNKEDISISILLEELSEVMKPQFEARKITLQIKLQDKFPAIMADVNKIRRLLTNLLGNTLKYVPQGGNVQVIGKKEDGMVRIEVADNGIGIAKENLEKIFDKFYQVDSSSTRSAGGVGLGLAIVKEIVASHGGKIWVESEGPGRGTKFIFTLPIA